jgi:hypothetical protein
VEMTVACCRVKRIVYGAEYGYAYPTEVRRGDAGQLVSRASYEFDTCVERTATDENNQVTTYHYRGTDLAPYQVWQPDGRVVTTWSDYALMEDPVGSGRMVQNAFTAARMPDGGDLYAFERRDGRGRVVRSFAWTPDGWLTRDAEYDALGRTTRTNNPYYSNGMHSPIGGNWTTVSYDQFGRPERVTTPDGASSTTQYDGRFTTVRDQVGRGRRQMTDALGRVIRVDESETTGPNLGGKWSPVQATSYRYDGLDNLVKVEQGEQARFFRYDGLGRLTHFYHPEQGNPHPFHDPVTNGTLWSGRMVYDARGLLTLASDEVDKEED